MLFQTGSNDSRGVVPWLQKQAADGYASAQYSLGVRYWRGEAVEQNEAIARQWLEKAAVQNDSEAKRFLDSTAKTNGFSTLTDRNVPVPR